jgi:hypothetical protein
MVGRTGDKSSDVKSAQGGRRLIAPYAAAKPWGAIAKRIAPLQREIGAMRLTPYCALRSLIAPYAASSPFSALSISPRVFSTP